MTPLKTQHSRFTAEYLSDDTRGWPRFQRTLASRLLRQLDPVEDDGSVKLAKFRLPGNHTGHAEHQLESHRLSASSDIAMLEQYLQLTLPILQQSLQRPLPVRQRLNYTLPDSQFLRTLLSDPEIICKPADKNLGLTLCTRDWYETEVSRMLSDRVTYARFSGRRIVNGVSRTYSLPQLVADLQKQLKEIVARHESTLEAWSPAHSAQIVKFLLHKQPLTTTVVPTIYLLLKVQKPRLCGRPIVPCTRWITSPASIVVDHLLQEVIRAAKIPWLVKCTKSLVNDLESVKLPQRNGLLLCADIGSLYTNLDTALGLRLVSEFLTEQQVDSRHADLIMQLLSFVMKNAYLQFKGQTYHQIDGTAMGTASAPSYANICVYMLERNVIRSFSCSLHLYRRFLDDIFVYMDDDQSEEFQSRMNSLHPKLTFEFVSHPTEAAFLDLAIFKGDRFRSTGVFDLRVHQKKLNAYLYIPFTSFHTEAMKKSFILTELQRYIRNTSCPADYFRLKHLFFSRLRDRGYPSRFLVPLFGEIFYADRRFFLHPSAELLSHPDVDSRPPQSASLLRRICRLRTCSKMDLPVFVIPYTPLSAQTETRKLLLRYWGVLQTIGDMPPPIIAYQSYPSLMSQLVFMKAKRHENDRAARFAAPKSTQPLLRFSLPPHPPVRPASSMSIELIPDSTLPVRC